jgi:hypothetical protein
MQPNRLALSRRSLLIGSALAAAAAKPVVAQTPVASPVAAGAFVEHIDALLAMAPAELVEVTETSLSPFTYADLATQLAAVGMPKPVGDTLPEGFIAATQGLPLAHSAFQNALTPAWSDTFGFWPFEIDRMLVAGEPPNGIAIFAGIDTDAVRAALTASGYTEVLQEIGGDYLTFGDDTSLATEVGRLGLGGMNQAVVRDGVAIFTREEAMIQRVTQVMAGLSPSILETGGWPNLMPTLAEDTVGVVAVAPAAFSRSGDASAIQQATFSVRAGATGEEGSPGARVQARIRYVDVATAAAEAEAIPERWASMASVVNGEPFTELMTVESAGVAPGDPTVAAIDFEVNGPAGRWYQMVTIGDLAPFVPRHASS